jgi:hypothetical protein
VEKLNMTKENVDERRETRTKNLNDATSMPRVATMLAMLPLHSLSLGFIIFGSFYPNLCSVFNRFQDNENEPYCRSLQHQKYFISGLSYAYQCPPTTAFIKQRMKQHARRPIITFLSSTQQDLFCQFYWLV